MQVRFEVTDTFCGEANYSWARRKKMPGPMTHRQAVRLLKAFMGITGERAMVDTYDNYITITPLGRRAPCIVGFCIFDY